MHDFIFIYITNDLIPACKWRTLGNADCQLQQIIAQWRRLWWLFHLERLFLRKLGQNSRKAKIAAFSSMASYWRHYGDWRRSLGKYLKLKTRFLKTLKLNKEPNRVWLWFICIYVASLFFFNSTTKDCLLDLFSSWFSCEVPFVWLFYGDK